MLMVKAGAAVDAVIEQLLPLLDAGDIVIDGGNSLYTDTERRANALAARGLRFVGAGVSGGEEGAPQGSVDHAGRAGQHLAGVEADLREHRRQGRMANPASCTSARAAPGTT